MSSESFLMFVAKLENDAGLRQELRAAGDEAGMPADAVIAFAARKGYEFTAEDIGALSDQQLDAVAGGGNTGTLSDMSSQLSAGGGNTDTLSDLSSQSSMALQLTMDQKNRFQAMISNILKASSDTQSTIVSNLK
jgi:predicted ribosomally synthesized peptide with nif11-like leader